MTYGETTTLIVQATIDHPTWTASDIAEIVGTTPEYVRTVTSKFKITIPSEHLKRARDRAARIGLAQKPFRKIGYAGQAHMGKKDWT